MQVLTAKEVACADNAKVSYEIQWTIPNWRQVRKDVSLVKDQKAVFETGIQSIQMIQTKWLIRFRVTHPPGDGRKVRVCWHLLDIKGSGSLLKLDAKIRTILLCSRRYTMARRDEQNAQLGLGEYIQEQTAYLDIGTDLANVDGVYINDKGAIEYKLVLTFKALDNGSSHNQFKRLKMEQFSTRSHEQLRKNQAVLLNQSSSGDLEIVTRDGVELAVHQTILKAQCPVFAEMLVSSLSSESQSGIVKVEDLSGKTMRILLHYFYTGDLLEGWSDDDTIVEFTYAAGKYQIIQVLELLDYWFGSGALSEVSKDVQLLNLAGKYSLKNAEKRLLQQIVKKVKAAHSAEELFLLFGYDSEEVSRKAEILAGEQVGESKVLEFLDCACKTNPDFRDDFYSRGLIMLAFVQRNASLKTFEMFLVKMFARITSKFTSAEELFALFGDGK